MTRSTTHAHRIVGEKGGATCECGAEFGGDDLWREHYEEMHDEDERARLENRDPAANEAAEKEAAKIHAAVLAAARDARAPRAPRPRGRRAS